MSFITDIFSAAPPAGSQFAGSPIPIPVPKPGTAPFAPAAPSFIDGLNATAGLITTVAGIAMPIIQTKAAIDTRLAAFETQLKADTEANVLAIEADQQAKEAAKIESDILLEDALVAANHEREIAREEVPS